MNRIKLKLIGLWKSRTHWAGLVLGVGVAMQPMLEKWLQYKLTADDFLLAGAVIAGAFSALRWITNTSLEDK